MHVTRSIDLDKRIVHTTITGQMTLAEIHADLIRLGADPAYSPDMSGIVDMRNATSLLKTADLQQLAALVTVHPKVVGRTRRALLVGSDAMYGLYRMFEVFAADAPVEYHVFRDEQQAQTWVEELANLRQPKT